MTDATLLIDISQFASLPVHTGIQRVLKELICGWLPEVVTADVGYSFEDDGEDTYRVAPIDRIASVIARHFERVTDRETVRRDLVDCAETVGESFAILERYPAYFLPEPTFNERLLAVLSQRSLVSNQTTFALLFDCLPQVAPQVYQSPNQITTSRYYRTVAALDNVACISQMTLDCLENRLRRCPVANGKVVRLGSDPYPWHRQRRAPSQPTFVAVGTIEPRKGHDLILAAFEQLWRERSDYRLVFIGARGWQTPKFFEKLDRALAERSGNLVWHENCEDRLVQRTLSEATGAIFVSELEGYGLPAVEALALGCPVIASASLPALEGLPPSGQIRLEQVTPTSIADAVRRLADPDVNRSISAEIARLELPTWQSFASDLVHWIDHTMRAAR